jgi:hypothetical protein
MLFFLPVQVYATGATASRDSSLLESRGFSEAVLRDFPQLAAWADAGSLHLETSELTHNYLERYVGYSTEIEALKHAAEVAIGKVVELNAFVGEINPDGLAVLPVGIQKVVNGTKTILAINKVNFQPGFVELTAFARVEIPQEPGYLYFGLEGIRLTYSGGIVGEAKLVLLGDVPIRINGGASALILKGSDSISPQAAGQGTFLSFDCNGFKSLGIAADVEFPRTLLIPVDDQGKRYESPEKRVKASFSAIASDWSDILVTLDLPDFELPPVKDIVFQVRGAVLDLSDLRNSPNIIYPRNYETDYMVPSSPELWRGLYARSVRILLPPQFKDKTTPEQRISFTGTNMLIDNNGLSGLFAARNLLPLERGTAAGWVFSVDEIGIGLEANELTSASFKGMVGLPVAENDTLAYEAIIKPDEYMLQVRPVNKLTFTLWHANVEIDPNSTVSLHVIDETFRPEAMLNGRMSLAVAGSSGGDLGHFNGIEFQALHLMTVSPYLEVDYFGYEGELKFANFPVSLENINLTARNGEARLGFSIKLNLMEGQFGGKTTLAVKSALQREANGDQSWKYRGIDITEIAIHANVSGSFKIDGSLVVLDNDPVYGSGIAGQLDATVVPIHAQFKARAIFGSTTFRYWCVDGSVSYGDGYPVIGPLKIHGFGGGAFYHMKRALQNSPAVVGDGLQQVTFQPDLNTHFGIRAAVLFNVATRSLVDGQASFEIAFNSNLGINYVGFFGDAKFMGKIPGTENIEAFVDEQKRNYEQYEAAFVNDNPVLAQQLESLKVNEPSKAAEAIFADASKVGENGSITAHVGILMDFTAKTFHSTFDVYVNVAGGLIRGIGARNRAGWSVMHMGPDDWYVYMGTPRDRVGLQFGIGSLSIKTGGYFMTGSKVLDSPPPPMAVSEILGIEIEKLDYMRDLNALADGRGFAFGSDFSFDTGDITFMILYARFRSGVGFDIMLRDYGDAHCEGSSDPVGIDGWYANGQAYAYLQGEVGVSIRIFGLKKKFTVLSGAAAVLLQAKLPNPTFMKGYLAVKVEVLGGLVSGNFRLKISVGDDCHIVNGTGSPIDIKIIADLKPVDQSTAVDVFAAPQAAFNMRMEQPFYVEEDDGTRTYRIRLDKFAVLDGRDTIPGRIEWNTSRDIATFYSFEVLPPNKQLRAVVSVSFELQRGQTWQVVMDQGKKAVETKAVQFTTSTAPDNIPLSNIEYAYPVVDQHNYYRDESTVGYIQLKRGQSYLFPADWKYEIRIGQKAQDSKNQRIQYNTAQKRIDFGLHQLELSADYTVALVALSANATAPAVVVNNREQLQSADGDITIKNNQAADVKQTSGKDLLAYAFHTSKHTTFADKISHMSIREPIINKVSTDVISLQPLVSTFEPFDVAELAGTSYTDATPLVSTTALPEDAYYREDIYPLLYRDYPVARSIRITNRDTTTLGFYPARAISVMSFYLQAAEQGDASTFLTNRLPWSYDMAGIYHRDFIDLQAQIVNTFLGTAQQNRYANIIMESFPAIRYGNYTVKYQYIMPGGKLGSSAKFAYLQPVK